MSDKYRLKLKVEAFSKGCKLHCEFDCNPVDPYELQLITANDSELKNYIKEFMKMWEEQTGDRFINKPVL